MKTTLVFFACVAVANAGVLRWTPEAEQEARDLYKRYCLGSETSGIDRDLGWHCKRSPDGGRQLKFTHSHELHIPNVSKQQLVFIETPSDDYRHDVLIKGHAGANHKTQIVVVPATDTHNVVVDDKVSSDFKAEKPQILYLRNDPKSSSSGSEITPPETTYPSHPGPPNPPSGVYPVPHSDSTSTVALRRTESRRTQSVGY